MYYTDLAGAKLEYKIRSANNGKVELPAFQRPSHPHEGARRLSYELPCLPVTALIQSRNRFTNVTNFKCWFQWSSAFLRSQLKDSAFLVFLAFVFPYFL